MKKFSLVALLLCAAMIGCKEETKSGGSGSAVKSSATPTPTTSAPPATAPVGS